MVAKVTDLAPLPNWPRLMSPDQAAAYLGMTAETMRKYIPVEPSPYGKRVLYDRAAIDKYLDDVNAGIASDDWVGKFDGNDKAKGHQAG
ncbi:helix-turn-helix domain-containing protein [Rosistilla oblonga]|uniref:helix-turn-helix domain-containing protein n=1 Tax=Rosistilla oblonga TaxID=2527990 RepID=UPI003A9767CB